jgi:hypothetical protein
MLGGLIGTRRLVLLVAGASTALVVMGGCNGSDKPQPKSEVASAKGWITAKANTGSSQTITLRNGSRTTVIPVDMATWNRCQLDRWYPTCR